MKTRLLITSAIFVFGLFFLNISSAYAQDVESVTDSDLAPSYAFEFATGLFYRTIIPLVGFALGILALFLVPYFILKRKNTPSRPYLVVILAGLLVLLGISNFVAPLQVFAMILSQPEQTTTWILDPQFISVLIPIFVLIFAGILLYRSSVIRKLIKKKTEPS